MKEPGKTCQRAKLTDFFQYLTPNPNPNSRPVPHRYLLCIHSGGDSVVVFRCPKITTVSTYYAQAWNLLDTATGNGAGTNSVGSNVRLLNMWYANTNQKKVDGTAWTRAPAALDRTKAKCGIGYCSTVASQDDDVLGEHDTSSL